MENTIKSSGKNAYEIRLELLKLAFNILDAKYKENKFGSATTEEVITEAEKLKMFISKSN